MDGELKIGIVIADSDEYLPLERLKNQLSAEDCLVANRKACKFKISGQQKTACVLAVECGIGKVNAAAAATALAEKGVHIILNCGLSGGISGISKNELCAPDRFVEHDFDLTGIGYKLCQKPGQEYIYAADEALIALAKSIISGLKVGTAATGDCFVQDEKLRQLLKREFNAMSCDMETAAIAYVCSAYNIKFLSIRKISDDAGSDAGQSYREINVLAEDMLVKYLLEIISSLVKNDKKTIE